LAYACLLIRRGRHDLAAHVLHSLEAKPASRFKDMVFYLQCQIGIETGDFEAVKRRLVSRVHQHLGDMVALSLLESCIHLEYEDWRRRNPEAEAADMVAAGQDVPIGDDGAEPSVDSAHSYHTLSVPTLPTANPALMAASASSLIPREAHPEASLAPADESPIPLESLLSSASPTPVSSYAAAGDAIPASNVSDGSHGYSQAAGAADIGIYQPLASDANTHAFSLWNSDQRRLRTSCRKGELEPMMAVLPQILPLGLADAVRDLDGGEIHKICFSFQSVTLTSLHAGHDNLGLVTGPINQSLLTMVRAENIFLKQGGGGQRGRAPDRLESQAQGAPL
jgi:hypothetical protein